MSQPSVPVMAKPDGNSVTAARRPIVAIAPLSLYTNGCGRLSVDAAHDFAGGMLAGLDRDLRDLRMGTAIGR